MAVISETDGNRYLSLSFLRSLGRPDVKLAVEFSNDLQTWFTGSVYSVGSDITNTANTIEVNRQTVGQEETITVRDKRPISQSPARFMRLKVTTGTAPTPEP